MTMSTAAATVSSGDLADVVNERQQSDKSDDDHVFENHPNDGDSMYSESVRRYIPSTSSMAPTVGFGVFPPDDDASSVNVVDAATDYLTTEVTESEVYQQYSTLSSAVSRDASFTTSPTYPSLPRTLQSQTSMSSLQQQSIPNTLRSQTSISSLQQRSISPAPLESQTSLSTLPRGRGSTAVPIQSEVYTPATTTFPTPSSIDRRKYLPATPTPPSTITTTLAPSPPPSSFPASTSTTPANTLDRLHRPTSDTSFVAPTQDRKVSPRLYDDFVKTPPLHRQARLYFYSILSAICSVTLGCVVVVGMDVAFLGVASAFCLIMSVTCVTVYVTLGGQLCARDEAPFLVLVEAEMDVGETPSFWPPLMDIGGHAVAVVVWGCALADLGVRVAACKKTSCGRFEVKMGWVLGCLAVVMVVVGILKRLLEVLKLREMRATLGKEEEEVGFDDRGRKE
ncbi:hypothetical protein BC829DRAFT_387777 [Chytridium lagenaria]|nr:hypothetical protein BC829DRAFT_387777 [Chytridium lagenaria]